ncbi:Uncharacterised protein [Mycobacteroides abscessus subsp. abscessus]|nr:Uncharacterised protein [Mycobacteroides abscessus subsp. abscessus]
MNDGGPSSERALHPQCGTDIGDPDGNLILFSGAEA